MRLVVGLGNPGKEYEGTRHNMGFAVVDRLAQILGATGWKNQCQALVLKGQAGQEKYMLAKPQTFMNLSGQSVSALLRYYELSLDDALVVTDDLELPPGMIRIRVSGSDGGHNGLKSITQMVGTQQYKRMRLGIGRPERFTSGAKGSPIKGNVRSYVLGREQEDRDVLNSMEEEAARHALAFIEGGVMENWSSPKVSGDGE